MDLRRHSSAYRFIDLVRFGLAWSYYEGGMSYRGAGFRHKVKRSFLSTNGTISLHCYKCSLCSVLLIKVQFVTFFFNFSSSSTTQTDTWGYTFTP